MTQMRYFLLAGVVAALASHPLVAQVNMIPGSNMLRSDSQATKGARVDQATSDESTDSSSQGNPDVTSRQPLPQQQEPQPQTPEQKQEAEWDELKKKEAELMQENTDMAEFRTRYTLREEKDLRFVEVSQHGAPSLAPVDALNNRLIANGIRFWGVDFLPNLSVAETYNDNIYLRNGKPDFAREADEITTFQPTFQLLYGNPYQDNLFIGGSYSPNFVEFMDHSKESTINHYFDGEAGWKTPKVNLYAKQSVESVLGGEVESGDLLNRIVTTTDASLEYQWSPKTTFELTERLINRSYDQGVSSIDEEVGGWMNYQLTEKVNIGVGPSAGWIFVTKGPFQDYCDANVRVIYQTGPKLKFFAQAGADAREFTGAPGYSLNGTFRAGGEWQESEKTLFRVEADRYIQPSNAEVAEDVTATGFSTTAISKINEFFTPSLQLGYQNSAYSFVGSTTSSTHREDNYYFVSPGFLFNVEAWWDINLSYSYRENLSSSSASGFYNNLFNISSTVRF